MDCKFKKTPAVVHSPTNKSLPPGAVSYTHLDVYKRQLHALVRAGLNVVMLAVEPYGRFGVVQQRARRLGFSAYLLADEEDLTRLQARSGRPAYRGVPS